MPVPPASRPDAPARERGPGGWTAAAVGRGARWLLPGLALALVAARFYRFRPFLDEPHAFRQAWTSYYALEFYRHDPNIFRPSIIAMGDFRHVLIEFPLPEWITALIYQVTGPTLLVDRLVSIVLFVGSAYFLFRIVTLVQDQDRLLAWVAVVLYLAAPLGVYYSRAVTIDTAALCCGHALLFYYLRYGETGRTRDLGAATLASVLGFLIKAPYVFYLIVPALAMTLWRRRWRRAAFAALTFGVAVGPGLGWYLYAQAVGHGAPDLGFLRGYTPPVVSPAFYVGEAARRLDPAEWGALAGQVGREVGLGVAWILIPLGAWWRRPWRQGWRLGWAWMAGVGLFVLGFFAAHRMHDFYQLTAIAPVALLAALPLRAGLAAGGRSAGVVRAAAAVLLVVYAALGVRHAASQYYLVDEFGMQVGRFVAERTTSRDLVIMAFNDADHLDPRYLYYADRRGWSIRADRLEPRAIEGLRDHGATTVVTSDIWAAPPATVDYLRGLRLVDALEVGDQHVFLHRLD